MRVIYFAPGDLRIRKQDPLLSVVNNSLYDGAYPININVLYQFGSIVGFLIVMQILTGLFLSFYFIADSSLLFNSVENIVRNINGGHLIREVHMLGLSFIFLLVYLHILKLLFYESYRYRALYTIGVVIYVLLIITLFLGYSIIFGQMSYWAITVITNLMSTIPFLGTQIVNYIWLGYTISTYTLGRFLILHYLLPIVILVLVVLHILYLHVTLSTNPLGVNSKRYVLFHPYFTLKDALGILAVLLIFLLILAYNPYMFSEVENKIKANPLVTPNHIIPEWYVLLYYGVLKGIPAKGLGVLLMGLLMLILLLMPYLRNTYQKLYYNRYIVSSIIISFIMLTYLGYSSTFEYTNCASIAYFASFLMLYPISFLEMIHLKMFRHVRWYVMKPRKPISSKKNPLQIAALDKRFHYGRERERGTALPMTPR